MLLTYSITKAKRALCDVAQFVADSRGAQHFDHCEDAVDKSTDHAKPHLFFATISKITKQILVLPTENTDSDLKMHALHYAN